MTRTNLTAVFFFLIFSLNAQQLQTIRGTIIDKSSNSPIAFANLIVLNSQPLLGGVTDSIGNFSIDNVPVGRYDIKITCIGYEDAIIREISVNSAKQTILNVSIKENLKTLDEITIKPNVNKEQPLNSMASASARMLSVEEAKRYAGGFDDPARLASSFAGVGSNASENGIMVRGNAPKFVQWKMEGVEMPNPSHYGDLRSFGGGVFTALSSQMLANSDFFTGAFPAEYNNALSGVFDIAMRTGNNQKREHTFQAGIVGLDASSEGPFKIGGSSSYLFNYRYSTLGLLAPILPEGAGSLKFQDLSFKLNFPSKMAGIFSIWGIGLIDEARNNPKLDSAKWEYIADRSEDIINQYMGAGGVSHMYFLRNNAYFKTTLAATTNGISWTTQKLNSQLLLKPYSKIGSTNSNFILSSFLNKKFNTNHTNKTGILITGMAYDIILNKALSSGYPPREIVKANGFTTLLSGYSSSAFSLTNKLVINLGINAQLFTLNNKYTIEPRLGIRQQINKKNSIGFAYGLHSRLEKINYYFNNSLITGEKAVNKNLDFTKAHHLVLSYDWNITDIIHIKLEPYYQKLFSVPVISNTSFSFINLQDDWFFAEKLQNTGEGKNYGVDFTVEKYVSKGYYFLLTGSAFNSEYKAGDGVWRNTRFNRNYAVNFLIGKEWQVGKNKQNILSLNTRFTYQGGNRYSPIDEYASVASKEIVFNEAKAYSMKAPPSLYAHFTASYKVNKKSRSSEFALKIINLTGQPDFYGFKYNYIKNRVDKDLASVVIPNLSYKIEF